MMINSAARMSLWDACSLEALVHNIGRESGSEKGEREEAIFDESSRTELFRAGECVQVWRQASTNC